MTKRLDTPRNIVVGVNSRVWSDLEKVLSLEDWPVAAIGHRNVPTFAFLPGDRVWLFSHSRKQAENEALIERIAAAGVEWLVYVSSSSSLVAEMTDCYEYPRTKLAAERYALRFANARILTLGLVFDRVEQLPSGENIATSIASLASFLRSPDWSRGTDRKLGLFEQVSRPFSGTLERVLHAAYGLLIELSGQHPCLLRPLDLLLRSLGYRWYGYTFLSNREWTRTMSY